MSGLQHFKPPGAADASRIFTGNATAEIRLRYQQPFVVQAVGGGCTITINGSAGETSANTRGWNQLDQIVPGDFTAGAAFKAINSGWDAVQIVIAGFTANVEVLVCIQGRGT